MSEPKYQEGQVVKIKSYEELKANEYHLLYSDEHLKEVANAEVAIYKVINDLRAITWYQVGQCGHNVIEIPEAYIKGAVNFQEKANSVDYSYERNFFEFSNIIRAAVCNGEYTYRDIKELLESCLKDLESKWEKEPDERINESVAIDNICVRGYLKVPRNYIDNIPHIKNIIEAIRNFSEKEKIETPITFEKVIDWIENKQNLFSYRWYNNKLRTEGLIKCSKEIKDAFDKVNHSFSYYKEKDVFINHDLVSLSVFAIQTVVFIENPEETDFGKIAKSFYGVTQSMLSLYQKKNKDYGNSYAKSLDEDGLLVAKIHLREKVDRYCTLVENNGKGEVKSESLVDTLIDMANYCVMTIMWIESQSDK